ncbi:PE domain-containing protein, partial [Mycobacterium sp.]|uniref:PE domain-containing protein n=1 Tax=Mycobacterium sp. TaxID=1785 RepID=UPI003CC52FE3
MRGRPHAAVKKPLRRMRPVIGFAKVRPGRVVHPQNTLNLERHMAYVSTAPPAIAAAAAQLEGIGSSFSAESAAAATPTTGI